MKRPNYLSPTSIALFEKNKEEFYLNYMADKRPPRFPQTAAMAVGSAFDAYVKDYISQSLYGIGTFEYQFEKSVEEHNRSEALIAGAVVWDKYRSSGALADILTFFDKLAPDTMVEMEFKTDGLIDGVPVSGKPDLAFQTSSNRIILDWKVNGYYSRTRPSALRGYVGRRHEDGSSKGAHGKAMPMMHNQVMVNAGERFDNVQQDWARQITIYGLLVWPDTGADILAIDQIICGSPYEIAQHRYPTSSDYVLKLRQQLVEIWEVISSDHFFRDLTLEESQARCEVLDKKAEILYSDDYVRSMAQGPRF